MAQFHQAFAENLKQQIGAIAIEMSYLDMLVGTALAVATGDEAAAYLDNSLHAQDTRRKAEKLERAPIPDALKTALGELAAILADRNLLFHGFAFGATAETHKRIGMRGKYATKVTPIDDRWIASLNDRTAKLNGALIEYLDSQGLTSKPH